MRPTASAVHTDPGPNAGPTHAVRLRPAQPECHFSVEPDALRWRDAQGLPLGRVPYADVTELRLRYAPSRLARHRFLAVLHVRDGPAVRIASQHWAGLMRLEDRGSSYTPFVQALRAALARAQPALPVHCGVAPLRWAVDAALAGASALVLGAMVWRAVQTGPAWLAVASAALVAASVPWVAGHLWRNRPLPLAPGDGVPARVLP